MITVPCCGENHLIYVSPKMKVVCLNHTIPPKTLAAEAVIGEDVKGCPAAVAALIGAKPIESYNFELWVHRILEATVHKQQGWHNFQQARTADPLQQKFGERPSLLLAKATSILWGLKFRTTKTSVGHALFIKEVTGIPWAIGDRRTVNPTSSKKKAFANIQQQVHVNLNPKMWARVLKLCGPVVDGLFILRVNNVWSKNDIEVTVMYQSKGYAIATAPRRIRRGNDGVWRTHEKL